MNPIAPRRIWMLFVALLVIIGLMALRMCSIPKASTSYIDRTTTVQVPIEKLKYEVRTDTVLKLYAIKNTTAEYFLQKRVHEIDSLKAVIRQYAARGDTVEIIAVADTVVCTEQESAVLCDTLHLEYLTVADRFRIALSLAPRPVEIRERVIIPDEPRGLFGIPVRTMENVGWLTGGAVLGAIIIAVVHDER